MGLLYKNIRELEFKDDILLQSNFSLDKLESVVMFDKYDITNTNLESILGMLFFLSLILGIFTAGITWLYTIWRMISYIKNMNNSYLSLEFEFIKPETSLNIIENNEKENCNNTIIYKDKTALVNKKYDELKTLVSTLQNQTVFFQKTHTM